jgi:membrane-associated phospholipid phosphatase
MYLFGAASVLIAIGIMVAIGTPPPLLALSVGTLAIGVLCGIVNLFWKISMHGAGMGSLATVGLLYIGTPGLGLWALAAAVGWARVRTRNHTPLQVLAGLALSAMTMAASFAFIAQ